MKHRIFSILLAVCLTLSLAPTAFAATDVITDVTADDWFAREVAYVYENNLMNGVGDGTFQPGGNVSRAMVWTTLARMDGASTAGSDPWYLVGQKWAIASGVSDGTDPNGNITREQLVTMLYRYVQLKGFDVSMGESTDLHAYADASQISQWAVSAMQWACAAGIINGIGTNLAPQGSANRAELAVVLYRYEEKAKPVEPQPEIKPATYTVTFLYNYGSKGTYTTVTVAEGQRVGSVGRPSRAGYTFAGWYMSSGERFSSSMTVTSDMTVYAKWNVIVEEEIPVHTHDYTYVSHGDGTHTGTCSCGDPLDANCRYLEGGDICCDCGFNRAAVAMIGDTCYTTLEDAVAVGGSIVMLADVDLATAVVVTKDVTLNLNGKVLTLTEDTVGDGVFHVTSGTLTINGEGTVNGVGRNDYSMAVWADGGKVIINGGTFTNEGAGSADHYDLIYTKNGGIVEINGGTFICQTPQWTLNKHDSTESTILVNGGTFKGYNPAASATENPVANFVAEGCFATEGDDFWTVEEVSGTVDSLEELMAALELDDQITLGADIDLPTALVITEDTTVNLNGKALTLTEDTVGDGVFHVTSGTLTINGEGTVNGVGRNDYSMAVWADGGKVIINGGTFTNAGAGSADHYDLIYTKNGGIVEINGGTFICQTPQWTLNKHDSTESTILVTGGAFKGYNPAASATEDPVANFVAEGCFATEEDNFWTVTASN